jgi:hypothetical protein
MVRMTPKQFYYSTPREEVVRVAKAAGTTFSNFKQIAVAGGSVGKVLAENLANSSGHKMTELEILYPERYESSETDSAA